MTSLVTPSNTSHPSLHEHLLWIILHLLDTYHGGRLHSATSVRSAVSSLYCHFVHMDRLQDHFLSHSKFLSAHRCSTCAQWTVDGLRLRNRAGAVILWPLPVLRMGVVPPTPV